MGDLVIIPAPASGSYVELASGSADPLSGRKPARFRKHILNLGTLNYQGRKFNLDENWYARLKDNFNSGVSMTSVPLANEKNQHSEHPLDNTGEIVGLEREGKKVYTVIEVRKPEVAQGLRDRTILGASAFLSMDYTDTRSGRKVGPALLHHCLTNRPYVLDLEPYEEIVAATADMEDDYPIVLAAPEGSMTKEELLAQLKAEHGVDVEALQAMGLAMKEAEEPDLELFYWRHLAGALAHRNDSNTTYKKVWSKLLDGMVSKGLKVNAYSDTGHQRENVKTLVNAGLDPHEELELWKDAWATVTSRQQVDNWVERGGHLPQFGHATAANVAVRAGTPHWYRFDITPEFIAKQEMYHHTFHGSEPYNDPVYVALHSGGLLSHEERMRMLGLAQESGIGNPVSSGGTHAIYLRANQDGKGNVLLSPKALARTTNYAYNGDLYGELEKKSDNSPFSAEKFAAFSGSSNELMVNDMLTLMDDIELLRASDPKQRDYIISQLKQRGIDSIRGLPVEDRIVLSFGSSERQKVYANYKAHPELLDPLFVEALTQAEEQAASLSNASELSLARELAGV